MRIYHCYTPYLNLTSSLSMASRPRFGVAVPFVRLMSVSVLIPMEVFLRGEAALVTGLPLIVTFFMYGPSFFSCFGNDHYYYMSEDIYKHFDKKSQYYIRYKEIIEPISLFCRKSLWYRDIMHNIYMAHICKVHKEGGIPINRVIKMLLLIDRLGKQQLETLLSGGSVTCDEQVITLDDFGKDGHLEEPYRTAFVLKILGKTTGALLCALGLIDCEQGTYGRRIGQELEKDDNYIRQLLNIIERMGILKASEGKGKQKIFTLEEDLVILPKGQLADLLQGKSISIDSLLVRELEEGNIQLEELFAKLYDESINCIIHSGEEKEKFEVGQLIESMIKSGVVRTFETSSSKRLRSAHFLTFYQLLDLLAVTRQNLPQDAERNVTSSDLTRAIGEELQKRDSTGGLARRYRDYVQYRMRKQIVTEEGTASIDFSTLKDLISGIAEAKGIALSAKMRNLIAEDVITSLKGLPITSFKDTFIESFIDNVLADRFLITSSEEMMNQVKTLMRIGDRSLENARDIQNLDETKAKEFAAEASLHFLSLLLLLCGEIPPQKLSLMAKGFAKKKGNQSVFAILIENFSSLRKNKEIRETEEFLKVKKFLDEQFQAFDFARFLKMYLKMVKFQKLEDFNLEEFIEATEIISYIGKLLFQFRMSLLE